MQNADKIGDQIITTFFIGLRCKYVSDVQASIGSQMVFRSVNKMDKSVTKIAQFNDLILVHRWYSKVSPKWKSVTKNRPIL